MLSMGIMLWAGILVVVFMLLLLAVDVTCYFVNKCGLIMCLCGKSGTGTKGHNLEEGKAAFMKDESKEPIVEVRTEDECTANHNAAGPTEPNETTPLTEPEKIFSDEKGKLEEAEFSNALTEIAAGHNSVIQTNTTDSKA